MLQHVSLTQYGGLHMTLSLQLFPGGAGPAQTPVLQNWPSGHVGEFQQQPPTQQPEAHWLPTVQRSPGSPSG